MKTRYVEKELSQNSLETIRFCNTIIDRYLGMGLKLTLRQLYYQLVTTNYIPNQEREYKRIGRIVSDGRLAGLIDWDAIEDRVRRPDIPGEFTGLGQLVKAALQAYRLPRWKGQEEYVELWVEKDALSGVLVPLAREFHVTLMVNRGYSSQSAMYDAAERFLEYSDQSCWLLYLGDHDPSGEDMVRDIDDRLNDIFCCSVSVNKIALTMEQVEQYNPPPNPAKMSDSRAAGYVDKFGDACWEVDALPPDALQELVRDAIEGHVNHEAMDKILEREKKDKARLMGFVNTIKDEEPD